MTPGDPGFPPGCDNRLARSPGVNDTTASTDAPPVAPGAPAGNLTGILGGTARTGWPVLAAGPGADR